MDAKRVLIIEDEKAIADIIAFNLKREGFETDEAHDGLTGLEKALSGWADLILLDVMLPMMDGFEILSRVRKKSAVPVVMLTAREEEADKVAGLDMGADDYITKPFSMRELVARVRANMRRSVQPEAEIPEADEKTFGALTICPDRLEVKKNGVPVDLTVREYDIIAHLTAEPGRVCSREELMEKVWGYEYYGDLRAVDVAMRRLREKLEDDPADPKYLITRRGAGYYFNPDV